MLPLACSRDSFMTSLASNFPIVACVSLNFASLVSTFCAKSTSSSCHGLVTLMNSISSLHNFSNYICNFLLLPDCTIRCTGVRPGISSFSFVISASAYHISWHTSSTISIYSIPNHDNVVVSNKCVVLSIWCAICPVISLAASFNCSFGSLFSSSSILASYSTSTVSILTTSAWACTTTFYTPSNMEASGSNYRSRSSEHNSTTTLLRLTSSCFCCTDTIAILQSLFSALSHSFLSTTFSALTRFSLSLNSSAMCPYRVLNVSEGSAAKSSYVAPPCSSSCALGLHMLIDVMMMNQFWVPSRSITMLYTVDGVATCGAWLTKVYNSMSCASIVCFSTSRIDVNAVMGSNILSQTLSTMMLK